MPSEGFQVKRWKDEVKQGLKRRDDRCDNLRHIAVAMNPKADTEWQASWMRLCCDYRRLLNRRPDSGDGSSRVKC